MVRDVIFSKNKPHRKHVNGSKIGPNMEPSGTPHGMDAEEEDTSVLTDADLSWRLEANHCRA